MKLLSRGAGNAAVLMALSAAMSVATVRAEAPPPPTKVAELFTIAKSENRNRVVFTIRVDDRCRPSGNAPVFAYWQMLEHGPKVVEPLLPIEQSAYGIAGQTVLERTEVGGTVRMTLNALPGRPIAVATARDGSVVGGHGTTCRAWPTTSIEGAQAFLYNVYAKLRWPAGVEYILLSGWSLDRSHTMHERIGG